MTIDEDPQRTVAALPQFKQPNPPPSQPPNPAETATEQPPPNQLDSMYRPKVGRMLYRPDGREKSDPTRTESSSSGADADVDKPSKGEVIALVIGVLGAVTVGASALIRWRTGRKLRQPTPGQARDIAAPLGRIAYRLAEFSWLGENVIDGIKALTATGAYMNDGPLLIAGDNIDPGVPANLQEDDQ